MKSKKRAKAALQTVRNLGMICLVGSSLAGCAAGISGGASSPSLAPTSYSPSLPGSSAPASRTAAVTPVSIIKPAKTVLLSLAPVVGPPAPIAKKLNKKIALELKKRNIKVTKGKTRYNMRGYLVSSSVGSGAKLAYIWDLKNKAGRRKHRISGEKDVSGGTGWNGVSDKVLNHIASDTANQLAGWMVDPSAAPVRTASLARKASSRSSRPRRTASVRPPASRPSSGKTASKAVVMAMVVPVSGAPGDGKRSLTKAIKNKLYAKGIRLTSKRSTGVYQVRGMVQVGKSKSGKQPIRIDWRVYDPKGKRLGTVTQKNEIPQGSLNGKWGGIADAAAGAAADGITKLLPKSSRRL